MSSLTAEAQRTRRNHKKLGGLCVSAVQFRTFSAASGEGKGVGGWGEVESNIVEIGRGGE